MQELVINSIDFLAGYPKKSLTEDGQKIALHLRNRGRPTEQTWKKYKESKAKVSIQGLETNNILLFQFSNFYEKRCIYFVLT